jgi:16S rRNA G966 N2-methylase RsmD
MFLDPPYANELQPLLEQIAGAGMLKPNAIVIAEHFKKQQSPERAGELTLTREAKYGDTVLAFYAVSSR